MSNGIRISMTPRETRSGWIFLVFHLVLIPAALPLLNLLPFGEISPAKLNFLYFIISFAAVMLIFSGFLKGNWHCFWQHPGLSLRGAGLGFLVYQILAFGISMLYFWFLPEFRNVNDAAISSLASENYTMMAVCSVFLVPVTEELLYRGLIFRGFYSRSKLLAYTLSSAAFAMIHITGYIGIYEAKLLFFCFLQYIPAGLCLAWAYARADSIFAPILMHMSINAMGINALR